MEEINQIQQPSWLVNKILFCYEGETHTENDSERKQHFLQHKGKHINNKEVYTDGSMSTRRKVGIAVVFADSTRRGALPEEASIHTVDSLSSMLAIENKRESYPILNQIYDILAELYNQRNRSIYVKSLHT